MKTGNKNTTKNISDVYYKEINDTIDDVSKYFFYVNFAGTIFDEEYQQYEERQIRYRNSLIGNALIDLKIPNSLKVNTTIYGLSSLKNKPVLIVEY